MKSIRIGVIGVGQIGKKHLDRYKTVPGAQVVAVADVAPVAVNTPWVVVKLTTVPSGTLFPFVSLTSAVMMVVLTPSAGMLADPAVTVTVLTAAAITVIMVEPEMPLTALAVITALPGVWVVL